MTSGKTMSVDTVNYINIGLMVVSGVIALIYPFYLFLFSYAVLGPLHYLTEISWLHDRNYFLKRKVMIVPLIAATVIISVFSFLGGSGLHDRLLSLILAIGFVFAGLAASARTSESRAVMLTGLVLSAVFFWTQPLILLLIGVFLPTLIHVFVFTGIFVFAGTLKSRRLSGLISLIVFLGIAIVMLAWHPAFLDSGMVSDYERNSYGTVGSKADRFGFVNLNYLIVQLFGVGGHTALSGPSSLYKTVNDYLYLNPGARAVMAFIAYAYTYHYLNWFSKTTVIGWHRSSTGRLYAMLFVWFASLGLYITDYHLGLRWLFFLSLLHVVMELPLNYVTIFAIGRSLRGIPRSTARQSA